MEDKMDCKTVEKHLPFFIEKQLPENIMTQVQEHLNTCSNCARLLDRFWQVWPSFESRQDIQPSADFAIQLQQRVIDYDEGSHRKKKSSYLLIYPIRVAAAVALIGLAVFIGNYLGKFPQLYQLQATKFVTVMQQKPLFKSMDLFNDVPVNSIESICLSITLEE
jgi:predicted anti-sigma-YlaC factor YlaD